jgi:hypothetical protein
MDIPLSASRLPAASHRDPAWDTSGPHCADCCQIPPDIATLRQEFGQEE